MAILTEEMLKWANTGPQRVPYGNQTYVWDAARGAYISEQTGAALDLQDIALRVAYNEAVDRHPAHSGLVPAQAPGPILIRVDKELPYTMTFGRAESETAAKVIVSACAEADPTRWVPVSEAAIALAAGPLASCSSFSAGMYYLLSDGFIKRGPSEGTVQVTREFVRRLSFFCKRPYGDGPMQGSVALLECNSLRWACADAGADWGWRRSNLLRTDSGEPYAARWELFKAGDPGRVLVLVEVVEKRHPEKPTYRDEDSSRSVIEFVLDDDWRETVAAVAALMDMPWSRRRTQLSTISGTVGGVAVFVPPPGYGQPVALPPGHHQVYTTKDLWQKMGYQYEDVPVPTTQAAESPGIEPTAEVGGSAVG